MVSTIIDPISPSFNIKNDDYLYDDHIDLVPKPKRSHLLTKEQRRVFKMKKEKELFLLNKHGMDAPFVKVGGTGYETNKKNYDPSQCIHFVITKRITNKKIKVLLDTGLEQLLEWRRPGHWIPQGKTANEYRFFSIHIE